MDLRIQLLAVVLAVMLVPWTSAGTLSNQKPETTSAKEPFTFDDIFDSGYRARSFSGQWIPGEESFLYRDADTGALMKFHANNESRTVFLDNSTFLALNTGTYYVSPDYQFVLFAFERTALWRHSFHAKYRILDLNTKLHHDFPAGPHANATLQYAAWSTGGHDLTFVLGNNLYYQESPTTDPRQLTTSGDPTYIYNGIPDWLYEEDVLSDRVSHYPSPTGRYICYAELNDTDVPLQAWPLYGSKDDVFGKTVEIPYPKAGHVVDGQAGPNTKVKIYIYDLQTNEAKWVHPVDELMGKDHYFLQVTWKDEHQVMVTWANRVQNESWSAIYDAAGNETLSPVVVNNHLAVTGGWVEVPPSTVWFINNGTTYLTILPEVVSAADGSWRHVVHVTAPTSTMGDKYFRSTGRDEADQIISYDAVKQHILYISTGGDPSERHLFRVPLSEGAAECLTCNMPDSCRYVTASFSSSSRYYILGCRGPDVPVFMLKDIENPNYSYTLENNDALRANLANKELPTRQFINIPIGGGYTGRAEVFLPPNHVAGKKYPLLVYAYAGPGSQRVMKTFPIGGSTNNWLTYLKSSHEVVVASLDGRGSMAAGDKLKFEMYRKLSTVEIEDQILAGEYLKGQDYIDSSLPLGIFGWSYGGGVAANIIGASSTTFTCGLSVAPVTTKAFYDTAYTERYLGLATPDDGQAGYNATDVMNKVQNFRNKHFFIAHGTADDNVHFMHAAHLISALSEAGIQFRQNMYVDQNHNIGDPFQSRHLYNSMTNFLVNDCWSNRNTDSEISRASLHHVTFGSMLAVGVSFLVSILRVFAA